MLHHERFRPASEVGEIAAPATRDQDLLADLGRVIEQQHGPATLARAQGAHQAGRARAGNDDVEGPPAHASAVLTIQRPSARPMMAPTTEPLT